MTWDKPITIRSVVVTPEQLTKAWAAWCGDSMKTATALEMHLLNAEVWPTIIGGVAQNMLQRARKAGEIRSVSRVWELTDRD